MISNVSSPNFVIFNEAPSMPFKGVTISAPPGAIDTVIAAESSQTGYFNYSADPNVTVTSISGTGIELTGPAPDLTYVIDSLVYTPAGPGTVGFGFVDSLSNASVSIHVTDIDPPVYPQVHANNLAYAGEPSDPLNLEASYNDLMATFGMNQQAMQSWYNAREPIENRPATFDGLEYVASYGDLINAFGHAGSERAIMDDGAAHYITNGHA
jgi:hypothetical protein